MFLFPHHSLEQNTIGTRMKHLGYQTMYTGKYLNEYGYTTNTMDDTGRYASMMMDHVPPGWDRWVVRNGVDPYYYNYSVSVDGDLAFYFVDSMSPEPNTMDAEKYSENVFSNYTLNWITSRLEEDDDDASPFFVIHSSAAPHEPYTPAPEVCPVCCQGKEVAKK